jgi:hypothetical protein
LRVPPRQRGALKFLAELDEARFDGLLQALNRDPPPTIRGEVDERARSVLSVGQDEIVALINASLSMSALRAATTLDAETLARDLSESEDLRDVPVEKRSLLASRVADLLHVESLTDIAKAANLITENQQVLTEARIISDIRPIFPDDPSQRPAGAVVIHTLKITSYNGSESTSTYFALDDADLNALQRAVERAIAKSSTIDQMLVDAGLTRFRPLLAG